MINRAYLLAALAATALTASFGASAMKGSEPTYTLVCDDWSMKHTSDPMVDLPNGIDQGVIELSMEKEDYGNLTLTMPEGVFNRDAFGDRGEITRHRTQCQGHFAFRMISADLSDSLTFINPEGESPQVFWQRVRNTEDGMADTFLVASCKRS